MCSAGALDVSAAKAAYDRGGTYSWNTFNAYVAAVPVVTRIVVQ